MTHQSQSPGMTPEATGGTGAPIQFYAGAARPQFQDCTECLGEGVVYGFYTNDPGEKEKCAECPRCNGTGEEPTGEEE